ncbi:trifunctional aldehyde reductase/xylose reductase/glucose 1-dehydrogenase (NADP(+)) Ecym_5508 [Eremothecium cymbalariae DBVPG|uniref:NADP-dependent oxidoreductase domain-containing protein n=1 Tax=Eremothecium cymbalariae (strain CBS 270.75 / DBVPG 7215 / KCTC 17166 / NRRL Y-17582) TaxID=931890 RepID=I6NDV9_ERECY|nr:hypothetical protein Ecym_5508 [Eremothecium cymbalariae DBVPG\
MADTRTYTLNNGMKMPVVGLGCWKLSADVAATQVYEAIKLGYRLFDGALCYGNEKEIGVGIKQAINEGLVKREDLFIVSKLWCNFHHPDHVKLALQRTLNDLGLDYVDLYYIHFPLPIKYVPLEEKYPPEMYTGEEDRRNNIVSEQQVPILDTYRAMEKLVDEGLVKSLGLSNFQACLIQDLLRGARIKPVALQVELHPYLSQERLVTYAQSKDIQVVAYSTFGPLSFLELGNSAAKDVTPLLEHEIVLNIAKKHDVTPSQVILRWATQRGIAVIPKSSKKERLLNNLNSDKALTLSDSEMSDIFSLNKNLRFLDPWDWARLPGFF